MPKLASQIRAALCKIVWNTGSRSPGELEITRSTSDVAVCCSSNFGEVGGALAQFVEQPRVLDGDDGLGGEILYQFDLLVSKGTNFLAVQAE